MERGAWTEERLDDLATAMRDGFTRLDQDLRDVRGEIATLRSDLTAQIDSQRGDLTTKIDAQRIDLTTQIDALRQTMIRFGGGLLIAFVIGYLSTLAAILTRGG